MTKFVVWLGVFLLIAGCQAAGTPVPSPIPEQTDTPDTAHTITAIAPTRPLATERPTAEATVIPQTSTSQAQATSRSATATWQAFEATQAVLPTVIIATVISSGPVEVETFLSPDGLWRAEILRYGCVRAGEGDENAYEQLKIVHLNDGAERLVADQLQNCGGLGAYGLDVLYWSQNSLYLYFTDASRGVPDGLSCYWERPMARVEVIEGRIEHLNQGPISPDGRTIAVRQEETILIWDLEQGEIARFQPIVPQAALGGITWSPDGQALAYLQTESSCYPFGKSDLVILDLSTREQVHLLESVQPAFNGLSWVDTDRITLVDENGNAWTYDISTKRLQPETDTTPQPAPWN